jgi:hypothetical protein
MRVRHTTVLVLAFASCTGRGDHDSEPLGGGEDAGAGVDARGEDAGDTPFEWTEWCDCVCSEEGNYLDLTLPLEMQTGLPGPSSIDYLKLDPYWAGNITPGGFWFRGWMDPDNTGAEVFFAAGDEILLPGKPGEEADTLVVPPLAKSPGDTVGPADDWVNGTPDLYSYQPAGVQTAHFQDFAGETAPDQIFFTAGIVGVRFVLEDGIHYAYVELAFEQPGSLFGGDYVPVRWGYNPIPDQPLVVPP